MSASLAEEVAAITASFRRHGWHAWLSTRKPGEPGPVRVCATRVFPCRPHAHVDKDQARTPGGETLDAATPGQMRDKLSARCRP